MRPLFLVFILISSPLMADPAEELFGAVRLHELEGNLPARTLERLRKSPSRFLEEAAGLILGFGGPRGVSIEGIDTSIAMQRAHVRAREIRRMLRADLDGDGMVTGRELEALIAASPARGRGRLLLMHRAADRDENDVVSFTELRARADVLARVEVSEADETLLRSFISFDLDGDGYVSLNEVGAAIDALGPET